MDNSKDKFKYSQYSNKTLIKKGKIKTIYENDEYKKLIDEKIKYVWNFIMNIDEIICDDDLLKNDLKEYKKNNLKISEMDEIIYYNKNINNLINVQKIRKVFYHFNIDIKFDDIIKMILYYTDNQYLNNYISSNIYTKSYIQRKIDKKIYKSLNIKNLYIDYDMFKYIFLNIGLNIESSGLIY